MVTGSIVVTKEGYPTKGPTRVTASSKASVKTLMFTNGQIHDNEEPHSYHLFDDPGQDYGGFSQIDSVGLPGV